VHPTIKKGPGREPTAGRWGDAVTTNQLLGTLTSLSKRLRSINAEYDGLENHVEAMNVVQAALNEMSLLHTLLPEALRAKSWVFLSLERGRTHGGPPRKS